MSFEHLIGKQDMGDKTYTFMQHYNFTDFSNNDCLSLLIRNVVLERPKHKRLVPQWDLGLVLSALKSPPCVDPI
jgi:hypothetical protein